MSLYLDYMTKNKPKKETAMTEMKVKLQEIFAQSSIKTLGDMIEKNAPELPGIEKFPVALKAHSLDPSVMSMLPSFYWSAATRAEVPFETLNQLAKKVAEFKFGMLDDAKKALTPKPN